jgi:hypothetical protein
LRARLPEKQPGAFVRIVVRVAAILFLAAGVWCTVGSLARGYMVASGTVEPGEAIYADELAPTLKDDAIAGAAGNVTRDRPGGRGMLRRSRPRAFDPSHS